MCMCMCMCMYRSNDFTPDFLFLGLFDLTHPPTGQHQACRTAVRARSRPSLRWWCHAPLSGVVCEATCCKRKKRVWHLQEKRIHSSLLLDSCASSQAPTEVAVLANPWRRFTPTTLLPRLPPLLAR